jgi:hypothetical protein
MRDSFNGWISQVSYKTKSNEPMNQKTAISIPKPGLRSKRITITGGKGFLGTHLIHTLKEKG